jgi:GNAT superfamily N-acetyltransferase
MDTPVPIFELRRDDGYTLSTDPARLDLHAIHRFLSVESYWAQGRTYETVCQTVAHSLCFGVYAPEGALVGLARVITDYAIVAWLADVFILPGHRGRALGKWLIETIVAYPPLAGVRRFMLATADAHELYRRYGGFTHLNAPETLMERLNRGPKGLQDP